MMDLLPWAILAVIFHQPIYWLCLVLWYHYHDKPNDRDGHWLAVRGWFVEFVKAVWK